jgi:hypothetical protein
MNGIQETSWVRNPIAGSGQPCTHALVIGVSSYRHLHEEPEPDNPDTLGLVQAKTPASSAWRFARWLRDEYHNPAATLGSIRLLLSASSEEKDANAELSGLVDQVPKPDAANVRAALAAWKKDCLANRRHVAILYAAGHGVQTTKEGAIVILEDFAAPDQLGLLERTLDVGGVRRGMSRDDAAQQQFYFVDSCRVRPGAFGSYFSLTGGISIDDRAEGSSKVSGVFFGASAGTSALGDPRKGTVFCEALLDCLRLDAVVPGDVHPWTVTTWSLLRDLPKRVEALAQTYDAEQRSTVGGELGSAVFHVLKDRPNVRFALGIKPAEAAPSAFARLYDGERRQALFERVSFVPQLIREIPAGYYILSVTIDPPTGSYQNLQDIVVPAMPPEYRREVNVE